MSNVGTLGTAVRERRRDLGLTQAELVRRTGLSVSTLSGIEGGHYESRLRSTTLDALDRELEWEPGTASMFYAGQATVREAIISFGKKPPTGKKYEALLRYLAVFTDREMSEVLKIIEARRLAIAQERLTKRKHQAS